MAKLEITWKVISEKNFQLINPLNDDLICLICKGIMVNATNAPCGCRYCCLCIKKYLNETDDNYCPGLSKYCGINWIDFDRDICVDRSINIRISQLTVKCPMETCDFTDELSMMEKHLKDCDRKFIGCPYSEIGCCKPDIRKDEVNKHLFNESFPHNKLLVDYVNNLRNEMEALNSKISAITTENICLAKTLAKSNKKFEFQQRTFKREIDKLTKENNSMKIQINSLNIKMTVLKQDEKQVLVQERLGLLEGRQEKTEESVGKLNEANTTINGTVDRLTNDMNSLKEDVGSLNNEIDDLTEDVSKLEDSVDEINTSKESYEMKIDKIQVQLDNLSNKEFIWKLEDFTEVVENCKTKSTKMIISDFFFVSENGYKMGLYAYPKGLGKSAGFFGIYFNIIKGPYDDLLCWPCQIDVTFELINQETKCSFISKKKLFENNPNHTAYQKPTTEKNNGLGYPYFIKLDYLLKQNQLIKNDQLFIKCFVCLNK